MKKNLFTLVLICFSAVSTTVCAQQFTAAQSSMLITAAPKSETPKSAAPKSETPKSETPKSAAPKSEIPKSETPKSAAPEAKAAPAKAPVAAAKTAKAASARPTYRKAPTTAPVAVQPKPAGLEQQLATFVFVVNRGEVFSVNAPGELTELALTGFTTDALPVGSEGQMNETLCRNSVMLTGAVKINDYSPEPATGVTAALRLRPLTAARGLTLGLTVDGAPLRVLLPFDSGDCRWRAGYTYRYVVTVNGGALQVTGMTVTRTAQARE